MGIKMDIEEIYITQPINKMTLEVSYQYPFTNWSVFNVFNGFYEELIKTNKNIKFKYVNSGEVYDGNPSSYYSPHVMVIKNIENLKYILISYWDRADELSIKKHGWNDENRVQFITSSGVHTDIPHIPFSYITYFKTFEKLSNSAKPIIKKENNDLFFKGYLYGSRYDLSKTNKIKMSDEKTLPEEKYFNELTNNRICLSLNGAGEICNRDIEILGSRSVLLRPQLKQKFHNELIPDYHYLTFDVVNDPNEQAEIIIDKFNQIKNDVKLLTTISENGFKWFKNNGTVQSNIDILKKIVNIDLLE